MKDILLLVHDDTGQEARLQCALDVVRAVDGHLQCLDIMRLPVVAGDYFAAADRAMLMLDEQERETAHRTHIAQRLDMEGISHEWAQGLGSFEDVINAEARLVDLVIVSGGPTRGTFDDPDFAARLATSCHLPVLGVPRDQSRLDLFGTALVAWDGSTAASAAIRAAVPLLRLGQEVLVATIGDSSCEADPEEAARYLARHGCHVSAKLIPPGTGGVCAQLLNLAKGTGAGWCVMGAYGRGRIRERLFGGTTQRLMDEATLPLFLAR
jgi:nucleotide-binding universal stress UspA family protein